MPRPAMRSPLHATGLPGSRCGASRSAPAWRWRWRPSAPSAASCSRPRLRRPSILRPATIRLCRCAHSRNLAATRGASGRAADGRLGLHRQEALALHFLAGELAGAANRFRPFPGLLFGGFFIVAAQLHFAENALALHLLLERLEGLVD